MTGVVIACPYCRKKLTAEISAVEVEHVQPYMAGPLPEEVEPGVYRQEIPAERMQGDRATTEPSPVYAAGFPAPPGGFGGVAGPSPDLDQVMRNAEGYDGDKRGLLVAQLAPDGGVDEVLYRWSKKKGGWKKAK